MIFWVTIAVITVGVGAALGLALLRGRVGDSPPAAYDLEIYRDQLKEVERDLMRGVVSQAEAERVRAEVSRRVLTADTALRADAEAADAPPRGGAVIAALIVALVGGGAVALYVQIGAPGYADLPLKARLAASDAARATRLTQAQAEAMAPALAQRQAAPEYLELVDKLRQTVRANPDSLEGLRLLVRNEATLGNATAAYQAQANVVRLLGDAANAGDFALMGDLMIAAAGGYVSREAEAALREALTRDPTHLVSRYFMGLYLLQVDRPDAAFRTWDQVLRESPAAAPWAAAIREQLEEVAWRAGVTDYQLPPTETPAGPSPDDIARAQEKSPSERMQMIRGMVNGLSDRLATEGGSPAEWAQLIGAYGVLGETQRAQAIWQEAQDVFADRPKALEQIRTAALGAGVAQ